MRGGGDRCRESAVERDVGDEGRDFVTSETVVHSPKQMGGQLVGSVHDDERSEGGDATIAWAQPLVFPDLRVQRVLDESRQLRGECSRRLSRQ